MNNYFMKETNIKIVNPRQYVKEKVKSWIKEQNLQPGDKIISQNKLSKILKIAPLTAYKALDELVSDGVIYRIRGKGSFVADRSNTPKHKNLGVFLFGLTTQIDHNEAPTHYSMLHGIINAAENRGYTITFLGKKGSNPDISHLKLLPLDGLLISGSEQEEVKKLIPKLKNVGINYLLVDRYCSDMSINSIEVFSPKQLYKIIEQLNALGHSKILTISKKGKSSDYSPSKIIYKKACDSGDIKNLYQLQFTKFSAEIFKDKLSNLLSKTNAPTAIILYRADMAEALIEGLALLNLKIPEDVSLIVVENHQSVCAGRKLTTLGGRSSEELGEKAANTLIDLVENKISTPISEELELKFIPGDTVGTAKTV